MKRKNKKTNCELCGKPVGKKEKDAVRWPKTDGTKGAYHYGCHEMYHAIYIRGFLGAKAWRHRRQNAEVFDS